MKTADPSPLCVFSCVNAPDWPWQDVCYCQSQVKLHAHKLLCPPLPPGLTRGLVGFESWATVGLHWGFPWCWMLRKQHPSPTDPKCMLWLFDVSHPRSVSAPRCALMYAKQPVELIITNAAWPLNKWQEPPRHNKITRERARNRTQMRFHSHKLPLYYT